MFVLKVLEVKVHSREKQISGVLRVSGVKVHSREKQPSGCVKSARG